MSYCQTLLIQPRCGMSFDHMKEIEDKVGVYKEPLNLELTTPKTVQSEVSKHYPSTQQNDDKNNGKNDKKPKNNLDKYKPNVPKYCH